METDDDDDIGGKISRIAFLGNCKKLDGWFLWGICENCIRLGENVDFL